MALTKVTYSMIKGTPVNVLDYGAIADDTTDCAAAFGAALDAIIAAGGGTLYIPTGIYRIKSKISKFLTAQQHIAIVGDGKYVSTLDFSTANDLGIELISTTTSANFHPNIQIKQLGLITSRDNAGTAIKITYTDALTLDNSVNIDDIFVGANLKRTADSGSGYGYWSRAIHLDNARVSKISKLHSFGEIDKSPKSDRGIYLTGECTEVVIDNCNIFEYGVGIEAAGNTEGVFISNCVVTQCRYGYRFNFTGGEPQMILADSHANASEACVWMTNCLQSVISNCVFYANTYYASPGPWPDWYGVLIDGANSSHNKITGNTFTKENGRTGDTTNGISINTGAWMIIDNNSCFGFPGNELTYGVYIRAAASDTFVGPGNQFQLVTTPFTGVGTRTVRQPIVQSGFAVGVTSGSVISFPFSFYANPINVTACSLGTATNINVGVASPTITGFTVYHNNGGATDISYIATGY